MHNPIIISLWWMVMLARRVATSAGEFLFSDGQSVDESTDPRPFPFMDYIVEATTNVTSYNVLNFSPNALLERVPGNKLKDTIRMILDSSTLAWVNKGLVAIQLFKADGSVFDWSGGQVGPFGFKPSLKLGKRLSALTWQSYFHLTGMTAKVVPSGSWNPIRYGSISIMDTNDKNMRADGIIYMRSWVFDLMINNAEKSGVPEAAIKYARKSLNWNMRMIGPKGVIDMLKGNGIKVIVDDSLPADIVTSFHHNRKSEVWTVDGSFHIVAYPEHQAGFGQVQLDRQSRSHYFGWLFTMPMLKAWFDEWIATTVDTIKSGKLPVWLTGYRAPKENIEEVGTVSSFQERYWVWEKYGLGTRDSVGMLQMVWRAARLMIDPISAKIDSLKWPVKFAMILMMRTEVDAILAGINIPVVNRGWIYIHPQLGAIYNELDAPRAYEIHGGADKDDHVVVHFRRDASNTIWAVCIRLPQGGSFKNGVRGSEYTMFKVANPEIVLSTYTMDEIPYIDISKRPRIIDELGLGDAEFKPAGLVLPATYSKEFVTDLAFGSVNASQVYGFHANLLAFAVMYDIPLTYFAPEEDYVDVCQQVPAEDDVAMIEEYNKVHAIEILSHLNENDISVDYSDWVRISKAMKAISEEVEIPTPRFMPKGTGATSQMVAHQQQGLSNLDSEVISVFNEMKMDFQSRFANPAGDYHRIQHPNPEKVADYQNRPLIEAMFKFRMSMIKTERGNRDLTAQDFDDLSSWVNGALHNSSVKRDIPLEEYFDQAVGFLYHTYAKVQQKEGKTLFANTDAMWIGGEFTETYAQFLATRKAVELEA